MSIEPGGPGAAPQGLASVLAVGNESGSNDLIMGLGRILATDKLNSLVGPIIVSDTAFTGMKYEFDFSQNFTDRSLVDKRYADFGTFLGQNNQSTGVTGGIKILSQTTTTLSISAGRGFVQDNSDSENPTVTQVIVAAQPAYAPLNLLVAGTFVIGITKTGLTIEILESALSNMDFKDFILMAGIKRMALSSKSLQMQPLILAIVEYSQEKISSMMS